MYTDFANSSNERWWQKPKGTAHGAVFATVQFLDDEQGYRREQNLHNLRMYSSRAAAGLSGRDFASPVADQKLKLNLIRAAIDTSVAHIGTNRPRPFYLTEDGTRAQKMQSKNLGRFVMGQFYATDAYHKGLRVFADAAIFGTGCLKIYEESGQIGLDRVLIDEIIVDDEEARDGDPRQMFQHKMLNKEVAAQNWPKHRADIENSGLARDHDHHESAASKVSVIEAWHLPSSKGAKDGRHVVCVEGATLVDEPWERQGFPFAFFRWSDSPIGFFGCGIAEELEGIQQEINFILWKIQQSMNLAATGTIWHKKGAGTRRMSNKIGAQYEYTDTPPTVLNYSPIAAEYYSWVMQLYQKGFSQLGISEMAAMAQKPAGADSGEALKTLNDMGSKRFRHIVQRWEHFFVRQVAEGILEEARAIEERGDGDLEVLTQDDDGVESIKFSDVSIEKSKYVTKVFPTSLLPDTPSGKLDTIEKLAQVVPDIQEHLLDLLDVPDLNSFRSYINAPKKMVEHQIDQMLEHNKPQTPLPWMPLEQALKMGGLALMKAEVEGYEPERIELVVEWVSMIENMLSDAEQAQQTPPALPGPQAPEAMPPGPMPGAPMPLPSQGV